MGVIDTTTSEIGDLRHRVRGAVVGAGDPDWDAARQTFNLIHDQRPLAIAVPVDEEDVASVVRFARERGLRIVPQRTGHNAGPLGPLEDAVLLKTDALQGVEIDAAARRARVRAGARWGDVVPDASDRGLAALHGSTPDVSIVGYSLGGGLGWYARKHGLAGNSVTAIEIVTADGRPRRVDHDREPELFWALRGGGGSFGVVTAIEFELFPMPKVYAGTLFFPWERSSEVLHAWHKWVPGVPEEATSVGRIMQFPPFPEVPEPLRGRPFALVELAYIGGEADGAELMRPLRALGPALDTFAMTPPVGLSELHMEPRDPVPHATTHQLVGELPSNAIDELVAAAGPDSGSTLVSVELRHTSGALARSAAHHGALATLDGAFAAFSVGIASNEPAMDALQADLTRVNEALTPYDAGRYLNFTDDQGEAGMGRFFDEATCRRLEAVKPHYDPEDVFRGNHAVKGEPR